MLQALDRVGETILVYEGMVLAFRRMKVPASRRLPTVSEVVAHGGWLAPVPVLCWLGVHLWVGVRCKQDVKALSRALAQRQPMHTPNYQDAMR